MDPGSQRSGAHVTVLAQSPPSRRTIDGDPRATGSQRCVIDAAADLAPFERGPMRDFLCPNCGQHLAFENSVCLPGGGALGFPLDDTALLMIPSGKYSEPGGAVDSRQYQLCANLH